jgi:protein tyrosine/serine phosphatase
MKKLRVILLVLMLPAGLGGYFAWLQASGNFHIVAVGKLYRSAQPSAGDLAAYAKTYGLRSVINLRGAHPGEPWYDDEIRASNELGLLHIDLALSARRELTPAQLASLKTAFSEAPAPILVHCKSGADRTGLAAALFLFAIERVPAKDAAAQLSIRYGHWPHFPSGSAAMDRTFEQEAENRRGE